MGFWHPETLCIKDRKGSRVYSAQVTTTQGTCLLSGGPRPSNITGTPTERTLGVLWRFLFMGVMLNFFYKIGSLKFFFVFSTMFCIFGRTLIFLIAWANFLKVSPGYAGQTTTGQTFTPTAVGKQIFVEQRPLVCGTFLLQTLCCQDWEVRVQRAPGT